MNTDAALAIGGGDKHLRVEPASTEDLLRAISRCHYRYLNERTPEGYWWYELESNVTITAEYLMLFHLLGIRDPQKEQKMATYILDEQREDGTWAIYFEGPAEVSTTVEAYFALKLAGFSPEDPPMLRARKAILEMGGIEATRIFTKIFLALFGQYPWPSLPSLPVESILLPAYFPLSVYDFSSWARATLVPISVILDKKPTLTLPPSMEVKELWSSVPPLPYNRRLFSLPWTFEMLDTCIKRLERLPIRPFKRKALCKIERWILEHQEPTGDWGGIQPGMVNAILGLLCLGYPADHPVIQKGLEALENFTLEDDRQCHLQSCISPVWDTALTCIALSDSGLQKDHPTLVRAAHWLLDKQIQTPGDWSVKNPELEPGGWAFEFQNDWYPDVDDSAVVLMALKRLAPTGYPDEDAKFQRGIHWVLGMRSRNGGWGAFDINNDKKILNKIPFADLEANLDPPTEDVTGRILEMMGQFGFGCEHPLAKGAIRFLKRAQEPDGCWWGRWGVNYIYGTWSVLCGLASIGEDLSLPYVQKAVRWLKEHQNWDGGWGETCDSYGRPELRGTGPSTASQTAWALMGRLAAGEARSPEVTRGIQYLLAHQEEDGSWSEPYFTGTGFPKYFMIRYHNYRNCFPLMALGRYYSSCQNGSASK
jgi:squalene-hopene/tetraprenyl-beta-curcumene cyclase